MTTESRRELLALLDDLSARFPDWRLGQMITNLATHARGAQREAVWDAEDEELVDSARELLESADAAVPAAQASE